MHGFLDWLVIGVHGTHLSHVLTTGRGEARDRVRVVDCQSQPLATFWRCVEATGMTHMRSTGTDHLDLPQYSLLGFHARSRFRYKSFLPPHSRPSVELFHAHCDEVIRMHALEALRVRGATTSVVRREGRFRVETTAGPLRVVLAPDGSEELALPAWAPRRERHVFHAQFARAHACRGSRVAVIGGGIVPPELARTVRRVRRGGGLRWLRADVVRTRSREPSITVDHVMFATGFARTRPGGKFVDTMIDELGLPCARCGYPLLRDTLEWAPDLFATGGLAELQPGPTARNITGARAAGQRLCRVSARGGARHVGKRVP